MTNPSLQMHTLFGCLSVLAFSFLIGEIHADCYENWSRCTPQTAFWTGILWKTCGDYCRKCKGRDDGMCVKANTGVCSGGYQCKCMKGKHKKADDYLTKLTCKLGI